MKDGCNAVLRQASQMAHKTLSDFRKSLQSSEDEQNMTNRDEDAARMTDQEEFWDWFDFQPWLTDGASRYWKGWQACAERKNAVIEQQAKELEAFRSCLYEIQDFTDCVSFYASVQKSLEKYGMQELNGDPTPLLTGEK